MHEAAANRTPDTVSSARNVKLRVIINPKASVTEKRFTATIAGIVSDPV